MSKERNRKIRIILKSEDIRRKERIGVWHTKVEEQETRIYKRKAKNLKQENSYYED